MGSREEIDLQCTKREGCGLNCILSATGKPFLLKFHNLINHPLDVMLWSDTDSLNRLSVIRRKLKEVNDVDRLLLMIMRYLEEYYGDPAPTITVINHLQSLVKGKEHVAVSKVVKKSEISTESLVKELHLNANDDQFVAFRTYVDDTHLQALDTMYGKFSGFTSPILSQSQLTSISDTFKSTLPKYYHAFSSLLNKPDKMNVKRLQGLQGQ